MKRVPQIERDTPILPDFIARCVHEDASAWLNEPLPRRWIRELAARANTVYPHHERFRRKIRGRGNRGRDYLWMFMRHWLAALLDEHRPHLYARLPASYANGEDLPPRPPPPLTYPYALPPRPPALSLPPLKMVRPRRRPKPDFAWAAAAHFHVV